VAPLQNPERIETEGGPRGARNLLSPVGILRTAWCNKEWKPATAYPEWLRDAAAPCLLAGETIKRKLPVFSPDGCLPDSVGTLIETEKGVRWLQVKELGRAKGVPMEWVQQGLLTVRAINQLTDLHIWSAVASSMRRVVEVEMTDLSQPADRVDLHLPERPTPETSAELEDWEWSPPDLRPGSPWYKARVDSLYAATQDLTDQERHRKEGLRALAIHHQNFECDGTVKQLQILWWEFPPEHWNTLWDGSPMNFLTTPSAGITPNAPMTDEQVEIAAEFIDELWHIGVFEIIPEDNEMLANAPPIYRAQTWPTWPVEGYRRYEKRRAERPHREGPGAHATSPGHPGAVICGGLVSDRGCQQVFSSLPNPSEGPTLSWLHSA
jgi:hypothetical protein